jgi:Holliday junction DNA helicase RuvA
MISRIKGKIRELGADRVLLEVAGLTYEVLAPSSVAENLRQKADNEEVELYTIYYIEGASVGHQFPRLVGFADPVQREFFSAMTGVSGLGVKKTLKSLVLPINVIARAIESENVKKLSELPGIGPRMAEKIIAELKGKVAKFALMKDIQPLAGPAKAPDFANEVMDVLLQLQYKQVEAKTMIERALAAGKHFKSAEEMLEQIFKQSSAQADWKQGMSS